MKEFKHRKLTEAFDDSFNDNEEDYTDVADKDDKISKIEIFVKASNEANDHYPFTYELNDDGTINLLARENNGKGTISYGNIDAGYFCYPDSNTDITFKELRDIGIVIKKIFGNLDVAYDTDDFTAFPEEVTGYIDAQSRGLKSLKGDLKIVGDDLIISENRDLESLEGCPKIGKSLLAGSCNIDSLNGCPNRIEGDFDISNNDIRTLRGGPSYVGGTYECSRNNFYVDGYEGAPTFCTNFVSLENEADISNLANMQYSKIYLASDDSYKDDCSKLTNGH